MKKKYLIGIIILLINMAKAQNLDFENWTDESVFSAVTDESGLPGIYDCHPYLTNNAEQIISNNILADNAILPGWSANSYGILRTTDAYSGMYAIIVNMWYNGSKGILAFGSSTDVYNSIPKVQFDGKLYGISGHYKYLRDVFIPNDTLRKGTLLNIATYKSDSSGNLVQITHDSLSFDISNVYEPFHLSINYPDTETIPDSVSVWFESKGYNSGTTSCPLSHFLYLDHLEFHFQPLSIRQNVPDMKFKIFPNPVNEVINLEYDNNIRIKKIHLMDISGKTIRIYDSKNKILYIDGLRSGIYMLCINTEQGDIIEKIVIR